ncbi:hypothetical protein CTAYLR_000241 [Chrysophaeum taylorii]|uniref:4-hydroxy-tetrahydrodipicolinate synthase n=1 Tax=Chrysophaeum taylorii TaxID=2483200 RepID=A0AAD7UFX4_9STRA|nr:hypothetical protein CTAYLR_000241 [Chrysophaeum taylorii]
MLLLLLLFVAAAAFAPTTPSPPTTERRRVAQSAMPVVGESIVALVTPMASDGTLDLGALRALLEWHIESGTAGVVVLGTTGEASTLTVAEREAVLAETAKVVEGKMPMVVGTGTIDTDATIDTTRRAAALGADASLVVTPYYVKPTQRGMVAHFSKIADAVDIPMLLYNVPGRTGVDLKPETVGDLAAHPRIVGLKEATGDVSRVSALRAACGDDFVLVSGDDATSLDFVAAGGDGTISVTANVAPRAFQDVMTLGKKGDLDAAREMDASLAALHADLFCESNPIPVKWALQRMGRIPPGIRLPLTELAPDYHARVEAAMHAAGVVDLPPSSSSS